MENIYIPGYGTFTFKFNLQDHIAEYTGEPMEYDHEAFVLECIEEADGFTGFWRGKSMPEETKKKISKTLKNRVITDEHKRKISLANSKKKSGRPLAAALDNRQKAVEARRGMKDSEEVKRKRADSISKATRGVPKPWLYRKIVVNGEVIESVQKAVEIYKVSKPTVYNRIRSEKFDWKYYD